MLITNVLNESILFWGVILNWCILLWGRGSLKNQLQHPPLKRESFSWISFFGTTNIWKEDISSELALLVKTSLTLVLMNIYLRIHPLLPDFHQKSYISKPAAKSMYVCLSMCNRLVDSRHSRVSPPPED